jgi:hydrogenase 3 maturation protease
VFNNLHSILRGEDRKILFVGIGNLLKSDDGAGVYISRKIEEREKVSALTVEVSIENYLGKINSLNPELLVLIDCMDFGEEAGTYKLLDISQVQDLTYNTHNISLKKLKDFFKMPVFVLGIQPANLDFGENLSYLVKKKADSIIKLINKRR